MSRSQTPRAAWLSGGLLVFFASSLLGCNSGVGDGGQVKVSEEVQKKTDSMLKNYGEQYSQQYKSKNQQKKGSRR